MVNELGCCKILLRAANWDGLLAYMYKRKDMEEIGCEDVGQIQMVQNMAQLQDLVNMAITCHILWVRNFVTIFSR